MDPRKKEDRHPSHRVPDELKDSLIDYLTADTEGAPDRERFEEIAGLVQDELAEQSERKNKIDTRSGESVLPLDPEPSKIHLEDIAHGLSNVGRFAGQAEEFSSVARHSVRVSREVEARGGGKAAQQHALVHDAAEAYLSDVPGPVKKGLPGYKHAERRLDDAVMSALSIETGADEQSLVKRADKAVGKYELWKKFPKAGHEEPDDLQHDPSVVDTDQDDKELFLSRARDLGLR